MTSAIQTKVPGAGLATVLLLEDHEAYRKLAGQALRQYLGSSMEVMEAAGVREALEILREHTVDVLVADVMLGDGNSRELLKGAGEWIAQGMKVVLFSNHSAASLRGLMREETVHDFAAKEDGLLSLAGKIREVLAR